MAEKSSFLKRQISKQDAIIQQFRPMLAGQITQGMDVFERLVTQAETLTKLGTKLQSAERGAEAFFLTPKDLSEALDEYPELEQIATEGRKLLNKLGFVSPRHEPMILEGAAPVGKTVQVSPVNITSPGSQPLSGVTIHPKK